MRWMNEKHSMKMTLQGRGLQDSMTFSWTRDLSSKRANIIIVDHKFDELIDKVERLRETHWIQPFLIWISCTCIVTEPVLKMYKSKKWKASLTSVASFPFDAILTTMCRSMFRLPDARAALTDDQMNPETIHDTGLVQSWSTLAVQLEHVSTSVWTK